MRYLKGANSGKNYVTNIFMSDLANTSYQSWSVVFRHPEKRLYCTWHVDKSWKKKVIELIPIREQQSDIYGCLVLLRIELDEGRFRKMMQEFLELISVKYPNFHAYFLKTCMSENMSCGQRASE